MEQWKGKVAIVTGASAGIGEAIVVKLVEYGVHVVALARGEEKLKKLAESLNGKGNNQGTVHTKVCDVTNEQAVKNVFSWVDSTLGGVSILINNAGTAIISSLLNGKLEDWQEIMNLNVLALNVCSREAYQSMTKNKIDGHIIQVNSIAGHNITAYFAMKMYNASKVAVSVLCEGLRHELQLAGSKIKVSSISPGGVETDLLLRLLERSREPGSAYQVKDLNILKTDDVANAVITTLATPPTVLIAELTIIANGSTIQSHFQPSPAIVENILNS
ncbi:farnesol dehydrogenase-like [Myzus persicae]|uniref:farnesol dehydrogenase-like n=1 Tax=Myzus persicae TaxID=13164 RepID=UPI000B934CE8|nr:farnesol dehydrogenase-like [Myzus persicae]XP_022180332.1 farnesol dehydrogenase-like [Myzus persicae]XP_022180333.1 farnesol dehydrogenase-like [Myzus persicae]